jgi:hypothetical protein
VVDPVSSGIRGDSEGKATYGISVDFVIETEEDAEASVCKDGMRRFGENAIMGEMLFSRRKFIRCQVLLDGKMGELRNSNAFLIDSRDETGACGRHHVFRVQRLQSRRIKPNCKNIHEFLNGKGTNGHQEAL